jgi:hypothetical protein
MSTEPSHLSSHHRATLDKIYQHPAGHNIEWHDVVSLFHEVGTVTEEHDGKWILTLGAESLSVDDPKTKDIDTQLVVDLRRMLHGAGYAPETP